MSSSDLLDAGCIAVISVSSFGLGVNYAQPELVSESFETSIEGGDLEFKLVGDVPNYNESVTGLYTGNTIFVENGRSLESVRRTCRHEFLHHFVSEYSDFPGEEDLVAALEDEVRVDFCEKRFNGGFGGVLS